MNFKKVMNDWIIPIAIAGVLAAIIHIFIFFVVTVPSESMVPTIKVGDKIFVTRIYNRSKLKRGDIVVFYSKELKDTLIKRLIGLPGDEVVIKEGGQVYINGQKYDEPYVVNPEDLRKSFKVPEDSYLFFGDNRPISLDARRWENPYIQGSEIKGKAHYILFPFSRIGSLK
jgi:signal peptidase I